MHPHIGNGRPAVSGLLITDRSPWGDMAARFARQQGMAVTRFMWAHGESVDSAIVDAWRGDWIIGFKADYILSAEQLTRPRRGAVNFHPAPPDLRGVGTYEIALREGRTRYGVTCHYTAVRVDAGPIVTVRRFDVPVAVTPFALQEMAAAHLYLLYVAIVPLLAAGAPLPSSTERWSGPLHTWAQLEAPLAGSDC